LAIIWSSSIEALPQQLLLQLMPHVIVKHPGKSHPKLLGKQHVSAAKKITFAKDKLVEQFVGDDRT
jgi:hypothetical protein